MRVVLCWTGYAGYLAACWRFLREQPGIELTVLAVRPTEPYQESLLAGLPIQLFSAEEGQCGTLIRKALDRANPDVVVIAGWAIPGFLAPLRDARFRRVRFVLAMDTPWRGDLRQWLAPLRLSWLARRCAAVIVPNQRASRYARFLGFTHRQVFMGIYGFDGAAFAQAVGMRQTLSTWPKRFLYVGRFERVKGLDLLCGAYARYRKAVRDPWPLSCYGCGTRRSVLEQKEGITVCDFVQPGQLPQVMSQHGVFVLPSRYEPWGVVVAEAAGAGLPVIGSSACGASDDLIRPFYSGLTFPYDDEVALARCFLWMHEHEEQLPAMGAAAYAMAQAFTAETWARTWAWMCRCVLEGGTGADSSSGGPGTDRLRT
jgi:glycosyltransferase involved in cell wall biosynthesis